MFMALVRFTSTEEVYLLFPIVKRQHSNSMSKGPAVFDCMGILNLFKSI